MLNLDRLFLKDYRLNMSNIKRDLEHDFQTYKKLKQQFPSKIKNKHVTFFNPGGGSDILSLIAMYDALVDKKNTDATFVFVDFRDYFDGAVHNVRKYLPGAKIYIRQEKGRATAKILFKDKTFTIIYYIDDVNNIFPQELKNNIDIYFERAFEMFRCNDNAFIYKSISNLKTGALMITDHSLPLQRFKKKFKKIPHIPKRFGLYKNFQVWQKIMR